MRPITRPDGSVYCFVRVQDGQLMIKIAEGKYKGLAIILDEKVIPQLRQILAEAEFLKEIV